jgi:hypothetical protein
MVRKLPAYMTEILLGKGVKWNKQTNKQANKQTYCVIRFGNSVAYILHIFTEHRKNIASPKLIILCEVFIYKSLPFCAFNFTINKYWFKLFQFVAVIAKNHLGNIIWNVNIFVFVYVCESILSNFILFIFYHCRKNDVIARLISMQFNNFHSLQYFKFLIHEIIPMSDLESQASDLLIKISFIWWSLLLREIEILIFWRMLNVSVVFAGPSGTLFPTS